MDIVKYYMSLPDKFGRPIKIMITANSPTVDKIVALIKVQAAITSLNLVSEIGLETKSIQDSVKDLKVFESQLKAMIEGD